MKREYIFTKRKDDEYFESNISRAKDIIGIWMSSLSSGDYVLTLERKQKPRSISQNGLMWIWFEAIARELSEATGVGYTKEMIKEYYCRLLIPVYMPNGCILGGSTSSLTSEKMMEFLNNIQADAATEYGITLPTPEDLRFEDWRKQYE